MQITHEEQTDDGHVIFYFDNGAEYKFDLENFDNLEEAEERAFELYDRDYGVAELRLER